MKLRFHFALFIVLLALTQKAYGSAQILFAPDAKIFPMATTDANTDSHFIFADSLYSKPLPKIFRIETFTHKAVIAFSKHELVEFVPNAVAEIDLSGKTLRLINGSAILHKLNVCEPFSFAIFSDSSSFFFEGHDSLQIEYNGTSVIMHANDRSFAYLNTTLSEKSRASSLRDADYFFELLEDDDLPDKFSEVVPPSEAPKKFRFSLSVYGGASKIENSRYYYMGNTFKVKYLQAQLAYDLWLAIDDNGRVFSENWDCLDDILNNIRYIQFFRRENDFYLRIGSIENLSFGRGLLMDNYTNTVLFPFDKKNGVEFRGRLGRTTVTTFISDITSAKMGGIYWQYDVNEKSVINLYFAGDADIFAHITDIDNDGFADKIDPEPSKFNSVTDTVIINNDAKNFDDFEHKSIFGIAGGFSYKPFELKMLRTEVSGEAAMLSVLGAGIAFPTVSLTYRFFTVSTGLALQTPNFIPGVFDRNYEAEKALFYSDSADIWHLSAITEKLDSNETWMYGYNYSTQFNYKNHIKIDIRGRNFKRNEIPDDLFYVSLATHYSITPYISKIAFFMEQKHASDIFAFHADGQTWGLELALKPHRTVEILLRYRERSLDANRNSQITASEVNRNFDGNISIKADWWRKKILAWWKARKLRKTMNPLTN